jgi:hypothetical protein
MQRGLAFVGEPDGTPGDQPDGARGDQPDGFAGPAFDRARRAWIPRFDRAG